MADPIKLNPVTIGTEQMASITKLFADEPTGAEPILAQQLTGEVAVDYPELITYEGLLDGTAPLFDTLPEFKNLDPENRQLSNSQIISLFAVDEQGDPIQEGTFLQGAKREIFPSVFSLAGAATGAKIGAKLQAPIPPAGPLAIAAKVAIPTVTTVVGAFGGYEAGDEATDLLFGPEKPVTPGSRAAYESGKTVAGAVGWLPLPFMISKNVAFGGAQYLDNINKLFAKPGPITAAELAQPGVASTLAKGKAPKTARYTASIERFLSGTGEAARKAPIATGVLETAAAGGAGVFAYGAEATDPGDAGTRLGAEVVGSIVPSILGARLIAKGPETIAKLRGFVGDVKSGKFNIKGRRQNAAVNRIIDILESQGEDVDAVIEKLASADFDKVLINPETGKPITLTAGMKADSPALLAIERSLSQTSPGLGKERAAKNQQANNALRNVIAALVATGDKNAIQEAAQIAEDVFSAGQTLRLTRATDRVLDAFSRVKGQNPEGNIELSQRLFDVAKEQLQLARNQERRLWSAVDDQPINVFVDGAGNAVEQPNFLTAWQNSMPRTEEAAATITAKLRPLAKFIDRKKTDLGLDRDSMPELDIGFESRLNGLQERIQDLSGEARKRVIQGEQDRLIRTDAGTPQGNYFQYLQRMIDDGPAGEISDLTVTEATEMRAEALNLARQLTATGDLNAARVASRFADGLLDDLNSIPEGANAAYDIARAYSRSLNDTFTRAFAGRAIEKSKTGAEKIAPELLAQRLVVGGSDPTYLRVQQINDVGTFAIEQGFEGAANTAATIRGTTEMIVRNARAAAFDSQTGTVNQKALRKWMDSNKDLMDTFPALKADLENSETANFLLKQREAVNASKDKALKGQVTFKDLLSSTTESPTTAVAKALGSGNKAPMRSLNNLNQVIKDAPEELQDSARAGLKSSMLEWAMTKGGATSRSFSPRNMYDNLFSKIPNAQSNISVMDWMVSSNLIPEREVTAVKKYLTEMVRLEAMDAAGTIGDIAKDAGPMLDFYLRISGSALGARMQGLLPGGGGAGSLVAAGAGSKMMRQVFNKVPESMKLDVMSDLMENPELLAAMMRKPRNDREKLRIAQRVEKLLIGSGFIPARRAAPQVLKEDEVEDIVAEEDTAVPAPVLDTPTTSAVPVSPMRSVSPPPISPVPSPVAMAPPPAASGPVNREQYAALFPNDIASGMIQQQGTALMADGGAVRHLAAGGRADGPGSDNFGSEASQHGSGGYSGNDGAGDQNRSMTPEERYADNARRLGQTYIGDDQNRSMTPEERYANNFARLSANLPQSIPSNSAVSLTVTPQEKREVLSQVNKVAQQSLQPDVVVDFQQRLAAGQFDPQKAALNPAQVRAAALNPTLASFVQPGEVMGITSLPSIQTNTNIEQPTVAPEASFSGIPVGEGKLMGHYDPATGEVELVYTGQYARGGAVNLGIGNLFRRRV